MCVIVCVKPVLWNCLVPEFQKHLSSFPRKFSTKDEKFFRQKDKIRKENALFLRKKKKAKKKNPVFSFKASFNPLQRNNNYINLFAGS